METQEIHKREIPLVLHRFAENKTSIIGELWLNGVHICDTLENKVKSIDAGIYELDFNTVSPRFGENPFYKRVCKGKLPRLLVKGRKGILIHCGNSYRDSSGCILVGTYHQCWTLINSKIVFELIYKKISKCNQIYIKYEY